MKMFNVSGNNSTFGSFWTLIISEIAGPVFNHKNLVMVLYYKNTAINRHKRLSNNNWASKMADIFTSIFQGVCQPLQYQNDFDKYAR